MMKKDPSFDNLVDYIAFGEHVEPAQSWAKTSLTVDLGVFVDEPGMLACARRSLEVWTRSAGFEFTEVSGGADIVFTADPGGAYTGTDYTGDGEILGATINVALDWRDGDPRGERWGLGDYGMQTFVHEIGHALGLGHPGRYFGNVTYEDNARFTKDTWQHTIMSYFDQSNLDGHERYIVSSPRLADLAAIRALYGEIELRPEDSVYSLSTMEIRRGAGTFTIADTRGSDLIDLRGTGGAKVDLREGGFSTFGLHDDNVAIAFGSVIEDVRGSGGADAVRGNDAANVIFGARGDDTIEGSGGDDTLRGGLGSDELAGGRGRDVFTYRRVEQIDGDLVRDFQSGLDVIGLARVDADETQVSDQSFALIGADRFGGTAGELRYQFRNDATIVTGDVDGDGRADFRLTLLSEIELSAKDFIL
ncbi:M10 family metallopeptidase C-terminal domain-containing protein [Hansschlegelia zhihuaiae]|uniref:Peptidase metallopeptidase domain-containing protein n=1 Tax=Hansschlegelia zhihuaiae TaxID=405005 RepID=A0A4Q0MML6_9HYPH|nr:M10 family metallopeptidase C-terminal domain-containing protein [Hansschlegelia zhihuaiae]RXF74336.1 hypothetical protein EK403_05800 [Hansschlegelia zhihuaiae]